MSNLQVGIVIGMFLALPAGMLIEKARRAWADLRAAKAQIPILRSLARLLTVKAAGGTALAAAVAAWSVWELLARGAG